jgi:hypothetical protein
VRRLKLGRLWRLRPRLLTLALLSVIGAMIVLANLTDEISRRGADVLAGHGQVRFSLRDAGPVDPNGGIHGLWSVSYGWPLIWRQYILSFWLGPSGVLGDCYSRGRLASNLAIWLVMLALPAAACEWLLRRHQPHFRWSLRTMLAAVGLAAALCGWFAAARNWADLQDAVIAAEGNKVWVKRWGPRWLDFVGADRYRRSIVGAKLDLSVALTDEFEADESDFKEKKELLTRLARLRELQYLFIVVDDRSPKLIDPLRSLRQLRVLSIDMDADWDYDDQGLSREAKRLSHDCLASIGTMSHLEHLSLSGMPFVSESLDCLAGLTNLKSLRLANHNPDKEAWNHPFLSRLPALPRLEAGNLEESYVGDRGLRYLSVLPRLKTLNLRWTDLTEGDMADLPFNFDPGVAELARLEFLEEVSVTGDMASATGLESLVALKHLKRLHNSGPYIGTHATAELMRDHGGEVRVLQVEAARCRRAVDALRQANPGIVIDDVGDATDWPGERLVPAEYETMPGGMFRATALASLREWKKGTPMNKASSPQRATGF